MSCEPRYKGNSHPPNLKGQGFSKPGSREDAGSSLAKSTNAVRDYRGKLFSASETKAHHHFAQSADFDF